MLEINQKTEQMDKRDIIFVNHSCGVHYAWKWQTKSSQPIQFNSPKKSSVGIFELHEKLHGGEGMCGSKGLSFKHVLYSKPTSCWLLVTGFAIITSNNPKHLEKSCITKGQYLSIFRGDYGGPRVMMSFSTSWTKGSSISIHPQNRYQ